MKSSANVLIFNIWHFDFSAKVTVNATWTSLLKSSQKFRRSKSNKCFKISIKLLKRMHKRLSAKFMKALICPIVCVNEKIFRAFQKFIHLLDAWSVSTIAECHHKYFTLCLKINKIYASAYRDDGAICKHQTGNKCSSYRFLILQCTQQKKLQWKPIKPVEFFARLNSSVVIV